MRKIWKYIIAHTTDRHVWRVQYTDDARWTRLLDYQEANDLASIFNGVCYIDYEKGKF